VAGWLAASGMKGLIFVVRGVRLVSNRAAAASTNRSRFEALDVLQSLAGRPSRTTVTPRAVFWRPRLGNGGGFVEPPRSFEETP